MVLFYIPLLLSFVVVINTAAAASLGDKTDPCVVSDTFICKGVGAPKGCPLEMSTTGLTEDQTKAILDKHNQVRRKVAKGEYQYYVESMKKLVWNEKLAFSAQEKVNNQCSNDRSDVPGQDASFKRSWLLSDPANRTMDMEDFEKIVQYWFDLVIVSYQTDPPFNHSQTDISSVNMTGWDGKIKWDEIGGRALISAETESLGCGLVIYSKENWRMLEMLCFYDTPTCSSCQPGFSCDDGLCVSSTPLSSTTESGSTESGSTDGESTDSSSLELEVGKLVGQLVEKLISLTKN